MKIYKSLLIIFFFIFIKDENVLSDESIFNINNIDIVKKSNLSSEQLANQALKKGFAKLINKILLAEDIKKISNLQLNEIKDLVSYYQVSSEDIDYKKNNKILYKISFDREKLHNLFFIKNISYSEILDKEIFILPLFLSKGQLLIFNKNYFYNNWLDKAENELIDFALPLESIEILQSINLNKENLLDLELNSLFAEYPKKNIALIIIDNNNPKEGKVYLKMKIMSKNIDKTISIKREDPKEEIFYLNLIDRVSKEIINIIKSQNLIDVRTPSFLNARLTISKRNNLFELKKRLKNNELVDSIYIQEFNKNYMLIKLKYLGKLDKMINQLETQKIILKLSNEEWQIKIL
tara:strand:+ start:558 stop:1607 length:1050 start_codon:yes stop_codon:yes gene_type:complete